MVTAGSAASPCVDQEPRHRDGEDRCDRQRKDWRGCGRLGRDMISASFSERLGSGGRPRDEAQRHPIHAVAKAGRLRAVVEDVAEMRIAERAGDRGAHHAEGLVLDLDDVLLGDRLPEARPAGAGIELRVGIEERGVAADAAVEAGGMVVPIRPGEGLLGALLAGDVEGDRARAASATRPRSSRPCRALGAEALAGIGEKRDRDLAGLADDGRRRRRRRDKAPTPTTATTAAADRRNERRGVGTMLPSS